MSEQSRLEQTPRVQLRRGVKALIISSGRVLLVKEQHADGTPFWTLPGGGIRRNESPTHALQRELIEELRCRITVDRDITEFWYAHLSSPNRVSVCTVFECTLLSTETPNLVEGIFDKQWITPSKIPSETLLPVRYLLENHLNNRSQLETTDRIR